MRRIATALVGALLFLGLVTEASATLKPTLTVTRQGNGDGTVTGGGIACGSKCTQEFDEGDVVTLTAHPDANSTFAGWGGDCSGTGTCTVTMDVSHSVSASFAATAFELRVNRSGTGTGTVTSSPAGIDCGTDCKESFDATSPVTVTLTATRGANSDFGGFTGCTSTGTFTCTVLVDANKTVTARFDANAFSLHVNKRGTGDGAVDSTPAGIDCGPDCSALFAAGAVVTLHADPDPDSVFDDWDGCTPQASTTCEVTMDRNRSVTANFSLDTVALHVRTNGTGAGAVSSDPPGIDCPGDCTATFTADELVVLAADAASNSTFEDWSACAGTGDCSVRMDRDRTVTATFEGRSFDTTLTIAFARRPGAFSGRSVSERASCERNRVVQVKKKEVGADSIQAERVTSGAGHWRARGFRNATGRFYAVTSTRRVEEPNGATITCLRDRSRTVRLR